jgi:hypothetical protein
MKPLHYRFFQSVLSQIQLGWNRWQRKNKSGKIHTYMRGVQNWPTCPNTGIFTLKSNCGIVSQIYKTYLKIIYFCTSQSHLFWFHRSIQLFLWHLKSIHPYNPHFNALLGILLSHIHCTYPFILYVNPALSAYFPFLIRNICYWDNYPVCVSHFNFKINWLAFPALIVCY